LKSDFLIALTQLAAERHLPKEEVLKAIEAALASAFKKDNWGETTSVSVKLNPNTGEISAYTLKTIVDNVEDNSREISLKEAIKIKNDAVIGEMIETDGLSHQASRIAAQTAKQVVLQRLREAEREKVFEEFTKRTEDIISGVIGQIDPIRGVTLELSRAEAVIPPDEQVITERYRRGQRLKVYVMEVRRSPKGPEILVSRSNKNLLRRLFELEVPEVYNGIVEIKSISREAGSRSKVAVVATQDGVDPVGSCIGMRGNRIQNIVNELQGEKIDVVRWDRDLTRFITNALSPAEVVHVETNSKEQTAVVVVPERQLSLAIGKEGQNARLAAKLTGWHLDIKGMAEWETLKAQIKLEVETAEEKTSLQQEEATLMAELEAEVLPQTPVAGNQDAEKEAKPALEETLAELMAEEGTELSKEETVETPIEATLTPEELASLSLQEEEEEEVVEEEVEEFKGFGEEVWQTPLLTPDAGKIRFAEDFMEDIKVGKKRRGGGGRGKKAIRTKRKVGGTK